VGVARSGRSVGLNRTLPLIGINARCGKLPAGLAVSASTTNAGVAPVARRCEWKCQREPTPPVKLRPGFRLDLGMISRRSTVSAAARTPASSATKEPTNDSLSAPHPVGEERIFRDVEPRHVREPASLLEPERNSASSPCPLYARSASAAKRSPWARVARRGHASFVERDVIAQAHPLHVDSVLPPVEALSSLNSLGLLACDGTRRLRRRARRSQL
jgi:hypothetical protein